MKSSSSSLAGINTAAEAAGGGEGGRSSGGGGNSNSTTATTDGNSNNTSSSSSSSSNSNTGGGGGGGSTSETTTPQQQQDREVVYQLLLDLCVLEKREAALGDLSKRRDQVADLAPLLWYSFGTIAAILQEIIAIYPCLSPPTLTAPASNRVCNSLALLQCVAAHPETRQAFLNAHIPLFLYPFLNTVAKTRPLEYLRLTSLGVIGALVKVDDAEVINFLLQTEIIPLCLRIMETGSELSKTVATFIVQKILLDDVGLSYICATAERFYAVSTVLCNMVTTLAEHPSARLLKHVVRCYLRLADNNRAREALRQCLPDALKDGTFASTLQAEPMTRKWLVQLLHAVASVGSGEEEEENNDKLIIIVVLLQLQLRSISTTPSPTTAITSSSRIHQHTPLRRQHSIYKLHSNSNTYFYNSNNIYYYNNSIFFNIYKGSSSTTTTSISSTR
ncbi:LOW QUALITY PROTEIN: CCR4-NOT transcription complex subunit 9-like, partial [Ochotona princeps]|uniref:LOW QUALITY PROTEIN: CCR4-NOT transcription complex subunit 9-like n=1 Tax=Ochotona princeps TaxID=9978 RepID=UPI00271531B6